MFQPHAALASGLSATRGCTNVGCLEPLGSQRGQRARQIRGSLTMVTLVRVCHQVRGTGLALLSFTISRPPCLPPLISLINVHCPPPSYVWADSTPCPTISLCLVWFCSTVRHESKPNVLLVHSGSYVAQPEEEEEEEERRSTHT